MWKLFGLPRRKPDGSEEEDPPDRLMLDYEFWLDTANSENVELLLFSYDPDGIYDEYEEEGGDDEEI